MDSKSFRCNTYEKQGEGGSLQPGLACTTGRAILQRSLDPLESIRYEMQILQVLRSDIHANWWGVYPRRGFSPASQSRRAVRSPPLFCGLRLQISCSPCCHREEPHSGQSEIRALSF